MAIRAKRICLPEEGLHKFNSTNSKSFTDRGYHKNLLEKPKSPPQLKLITEYHHGLQLLNTILKYGINIFHVSSHTVQRILYKAPLQPLSPITQNQADASAPDNTQTLIHYQHNSQLVLSYVIQKKMQNL